jgi:hypothetical protein
MSGSGPAPFFPALPKKINSQQMDDPWDKTSN